jgi:hypothetical protein
MLMNGQGRWRWAGGLKYSAASIKHPHRPVGSLKISDFKPLADKPALPNPRLYYLARKIRIAGRP